MTIPIAKGGTGATNAEDARNALGVWSTGGILPATMTDSAHEKVEGLASEVDLLLMWTPNEYVLVKRDSGRPASDALVAVPFTPSAYRTLTAFLSAYRMGRESYETLYGQDG